VTLICSPHKSRLLARRSIATANFVNFDKRTVRQVQGDVRHTVTRSTANEAASRVVPDHGAAVHRGRILGIGGQHPALKAYRASLLRDGAHAKTSAAELAHLFGGHSLRRFRGFALSGGFGEAIGAVAGHSPLGRRLAFRLSVSRRDHGIDRVRRKSLPATKSNR
jgi:hypothetical protein